MNDVAADLPAPWWRRLWAHPGFHGVVRMLGEILAFAVLAMGIGWALRKLIPLPPIRFEVSANEQGATVFLRALRSIFGALLAYVLLVVFVQRRKLSELAPRKALPHVAAGWGLGTAILVLAALLMAAVGVLRWEGGINADAALLGPLFVLGLVPGITEEIVARGVLLGVVERGLGTWTALVISALLFGFGHAANPNATLWSSVAIAIEAGLLLGMAYVWTRSLWFVFALHAAWNFTQGPLLGIPVSGLKIEGLMTAKASGPELLSGGAFGAEASVLTVAMCVGIAAWFTRKAIADGRIVRPAWKRPRGDSPHFD
jgi:membrane protease YdiL (CAAX protease family)